MSTRNDTIRRASPRRLPAWSQAFLALAASAFAQAPGESSTAAERPILLLYDTRAGHSGGKPFRKVVEDLSLEVAFLFWQLGVVTPEPDVPAKPGRPGEGSG